MGPKLKIFCQCTSITTSYSEEVLHYECWQGSVFQRACLYPEGLGLGEVVQKEDVTDETDTSYFWKVYTIIILVSVEHVTLFV